MVPYPFCFNLFRVLDNHKKYSRTNFLTLKFTKLLTLPPAFAWSAPFLEDNKWFFYKKLALPGLTETAQKFWNEIQK